jgi:hypothetical protein
VRARRVGCLPVRADRGRAFGALVSPYSLVGTLIRGRVSVLAADTSQRVRGNTARQAAPQIAAAGRAGGLEGILPTRRSRVADVTSTQNSCGLRSPALARRRRRWLLSLNSVHGSSAEARCAQPRHLLPTQSGRRTIRPVRKLPAGRHGHGSRKQAKGGSDYAAGTALINFCNEIGTWHPNDLTRHMPIDDFTAVWGSPSPASLLGNTYCASSTNQASKSGPIRTHAPRRRISQAPIEPSGVVGEQSGMPTARA